MVMNKEKLSITRGEDQIIDLLQPSLEEVLSTIMEQALVDFSQRQVIVVPQSSATAALVDALSLLWTGGVELGVEEFSLLQLKADTGLSTRGVLGYISKFGLRRTSQIVTTTTNQLTKLIITGQRQGQTPTEIVKHLINKAPELARARAKIIAATEVHAASQFGLITAARSTQKVLTKGWVTVEDDRVRDFGKNSEFSHMLAHGQQTALDGSFSIPRIGGQFERLDFPGDPNGSAGNVINCRCTMTFGAA